MCLASLLAEWHYLTRTRHGLIRRGPAPRVLSRAATVNWAGTTASLNPALPLPQFTHYGSNGITVYHSGYTDVYGATFRVQGLTGYDWFALTVVGQGLLEQMATPAVPASLNGSPAPSARLELFNLETGVT
jgi:hypothetical protein